MDVTHDKVKWHVTIFRVWTLWRNKLGEATTTGKAVQQRGDKIKMAIPGYQVQRVCSFRHLEPKKVEIANPFSSSFYYDYGLRLQLPTPNNFFLRGRLTVSLATTFCGGAGGHWRSRKRNELRTGGG